MLALCSLMSAYFDSPTLKSLEISVDEFPAFDEPPTISMSDILPLATQTWPQLRTISLRYVPLTTADATILVASLRGHFESFSCWCSWVVQGSWLDVVDRFRELDVLHSFEIDYSKGGEFADDHWNHPHEFPFSRKELEVYVLRAAVESPLPNYFTTSEPEV